MSEKLEPFLSELLLGIRKNRSGLLLAILQYGLMSSAAYFVGKKVKELLDPTNKNKHTAAKKAKEICDRLGIEQVHEFNEYELMIASHLMVPKEINVSWADIGGLKDVIQDLQRTVIIPIKQSDLFSDSKLTQPPKGVLLHGPPGCGKTMIAKATAKEAGTRFINLDVSILTDKWYGESQKLAASVFSLAKKLQPCIIFIDEIDSFLRSRSAQDHEATAMMKAQFMTLWDGLATDSTCTVIVMGATNRPHDLDKAIQRRMPATFHIGLPELEQRRDVLNLILDGEPLEADIDVNYLANESEGFSGADLTELCRNACMFRIQDYMRKQMRLNYDNLEGESHSSDEDKEKLRLISMGDLRDSLTKIKKSKVNMTGLYLD